PAFIYTSEPWAALSIGRPIFRLSVHEGANEPARRSVRHDHRERHRYRPRLCARQHGRDHRVPVGRVRDRTVHWSAAPAPPRTSGERVTYRAAVARWPAARVKELTHLSRFAP